MVRYVDWIKRWYPLPDTLPDEVYSLIIEYAFDPHCDPWWHKKMTCGCAIPSVRTIRSQFYRPNRRMAPRVKTPNCKPGVSRICNGGRACVSLKKECRKAKPPSAKTPRTRTPNCNPGVSRICNGGRACVSLKKACKGEGGPKKKKTESKKAEQVKRAVRAPTGELLEDWMGGAPVNQRYMTLATKYKTEANKISTMSARKKALLEKSEYYLMLAYYGNATNDENEEFNRRNKKNHSNSYKG